MSFPPTTTTTTSHVPLVFLSPADLQKINGNRCISTCRNHYRYFIDLFKLKKKGVTGIPLHLYAEYMGISPAMILDKLGLRS